MKADTTEVTEQEECGACGRTFPTLSEVFTHDCPAIDTSYYAPHATKLGDSIDPPEGGGSGRSSRGGPSKTNRYPGNCVKCGGRVKAEAGFLVKDNSKQAGGTVWGVEHKPGECVKNAKPVESSKRTISPKQEGFLRSLLAERNPEANADEVIAALNTLPNPVAGASAMIDALKKLPKQAPKVHSEEVGDGFWYMHGDPGTVVKVQRAVHGSGNLYAKRLEIQEDHTSFTMQHGSSKQHPGVFEYWQGGYNQLVKAVANGTAERLTPEKASELGHLYGMCCCCGATLTDEISIAAGIGPVCAKKL